MFGRSAPLCAEFEKFGDVGAGGEGGGAAGDDEAADRVVVLRLGKRAGHRGIHRLRQRVFLFRPVHPDNADAGLVAHLDGIGHWSSFPVRGRLRAAIDIIIERRIEADSGVIIDPRGAGRYVPPRRGPSPAPSGLGRSQVVRQRILIPPFGGSNPPAPANQSSLCEWPSHRREEAHIFGQI